MGFQDRGYSRAGRQPIAPEWTGVMIVIAINVALWLLNVIGTGDLVREIIPLRFSLNDLGAVRSDLPEHLLTNFWQLLTYGFLHDGPSLEQPGAPFSPWHLIFNMLTLWFFGREVEGLMGRAEFLRFYCLAVVMSGIAWVVSEQFGGFGGRLVGASGGVMAVLAVFIWHFPHQTVYFWGVLPVPVWALGVLYFVIDLRGAFTGTSNVAHGAHLAGAIFGLLYAWRGWSLADLGTIVAGILPTRRGIRIFRPGDEPPADMAGEPDDGTLQDAVDRILAKISRSGESSLTAAERETLTRASRRLKDRSSRR